MSHETLNFEEFRRRREANAGTVRCAKCGERVVATAATCPACGVHLQGEAQDFTHASERAEGRGGAPAWVVMLSLLLLLAMTLAALRVF